MNPNLIYYPVLAMIVLTATVLIRMFVLRVKGIKSGQVDFRYFKTYNMPTQIPPKQVQAERNFSNLFEVPVLFYTVCAFSLITQNVDHVMLTLAWSYFTLRALHSLIHLTTNKIIPRMSLYGLSWIVLMIMAIKLGLMVA